MQDFNLNKEFYTKKEVEAIIETAISIGIMRRITEEITQLDIQQKETDEKCDFLLGPEYNQKIKYAN